MTKYIGTILVIIILTLPDNINAQDTLRGVKYGFLPTLSFNTDKGIILGGDVKRFQYGEGDLEPYENYMTFSLFMNSNGAFTGNVSRNQVKTFGTNVRTSSSMWISQNFGNYYLGDTDEIAFDRARYDTTSYYSFKSFMFNIGGGTRFPLYLGKGIQRTDIKTGLRVVYESPWGNSPGQFINSDEVEGSSGAFLSLIDLGFVIERRNSEFRAQRGFVFDAGLKYAPPLISTHHTLQNYFVFMGAVPLVENPFTLYLATKINMVNTLGKTPYWFKPYLGGSSQLRGYMYRRFSSDNIMAYNLELRSWLLKIPFKNIELGLNFFYDGGREFSNNHWNKVFQSHKHTLGFGGVMSIFTPDYILKYDIGFSEEGMGIYLGTGYAF